MQRREHKVPRLRRGQCNASRLRIAHLAHHNHVRRLPQSRPQRSREVGRIDTNFHLLDHAQIVAVFVLDRILNRHNVPCLTLVDFVHQRGPEW
jgi:hypothetical protein